MRGFDLKQGDTRPLLIYLQVDSEPFSFITLTSKVGGATAVRGVSIRLNCPADRTRDSCRPADSFGLSALGDVTFSALFPGQLGLTPLAEGRYGLEVEVWNLSAGTTREYGVAFSGNRRAVAGQLELAPNQEGPGFFDPVTHGAGKFIRVQDVGAKPSAGTSTVTLDAFTKKLTGIGTKWDVELLPGSLVWLYKAGLEGWRSARITSVESATVAYVDAAPHAGGSYPFACSSIDYFARVAEYVDESHLWVEPLWAVDWVAPVPTTLLYPLAGVLFDGIEADGAKWPGFGSIPLRVNARP